MFGADSVLVVLPTWNELAMVPVWPRTVGDRFQSNLCSTDVVVRDFCLYTLNHL
jgi:hypothetical protein